MISDETARSTSSGWLEDFYGRARAGELEAPPYAGWIVTRACNLKCFYCFAEAGKKDPDELTTEEGKRLIEDFADSGVAHITFLGGEPLIRKDIYELIDYASDLGIYAGILTNGLLVKDGTVERLRDVGCEAHGDSIDSNDPAVQDAVRGGRGSLVGAKRALRSAMDSGMRTGVRVVVTEQSLPAVTHLFEWAFAEGIEEFVLLPLYMVGRAAGTADDRRMDILGKELFFEALSRIRTAGERIGVHVPHQTIACCQPVDLTAPDSDARHLGHTMGYHESRGCKVGRFMVTVQPNGDVYSCPYVPYRIGSLRTQSIREIWRAPLLQQARKEDLGCLSRSMIHTGRPDVLDPTYGRPADELLRELASTSGAAEA